MRLKIRFPGTLLSFGKHHNKHNILGKTPKDRREQKYVIYLLGLWLIVFVMSLNRCNAETRPLRIGEKIPDLTIARLINARVYSVKTSQFKGKVLVLDFWASWCGACIEEMPEVAKLKRSVGDRLQVISVTTQPAQIILNFLKHNDLARSQHLTIATDDKVLSELFPHVLVPHVVWISPDGTYLGATTQQDLNVNTVNQILESGHADFKDFKNDNLTFDPDKPLFQNGNGGEPSSFRYRCVLTGYQPGLPSTLSIRKDSLSATIRATNVGLNGLIMRALGLSPARYGHNRFYIEKPLDSLVISSDRKNLFCFELYGQGFDRIRAQREMLAYLENYFGFRAVRQRRLTQCLVLKSIGDHAQLIYSGRDSTDNLSDRTTAKKFIRGEIITSFSAFLDHSAGFVPVINESGVTGRVSMEFDEVQPENVDALNRQLLKYGLTLKDDQRLLEMIVVSKSPANQSNY